VNQSAHIVIKVRVSNLDGIAKRELGEVWRKRFSGRHLRVSHEDGNHRDIPRQRGADLVSHIVVVTKQATPLIFVGDHQPLFTYYGDKRMAGAHSVPNDAREVSAWANARDIHKDATGKARVQAIVESPRIALCVIAPVTNEYVLECHELLR
jgi:hypothetical protein